MTLEASEELSADEDKLLCLIDRISNEILSTGNVSHIVASNPLLG